MFRFFDRNERYRLCQELLKKVDTLSTIGEGLSREYKKVFGITSTVLYSVPFFENINVKPTNKKIIRLVHHGVANKNRQLEKMIEIVERSDERFSLDMLLTGDSRYIDNLKRKCTQERVRVLDPVPYDQIIPTLSGYDIGFLYFEPTTRNLELCLPNKFFEYIQARLAIFSGPTPDQMSITDQFACGFYSNSFSVEETSLKLSSISAEEIDTYKENSDYASKVLNYETQIKKTKLYD